MPGFVFALKLIAGAIAEYLIANAWQIVASYALNRLAYKKPKFASENQGHKQVLRSAIAEHIILYGTDKVSGPLVYTQSTGPNNEFIHIVIPIAAHEVEAINSVFFGDYEIKNSDLDVSGNVVSGRYANRARIKKHLGSPTQAADPDLMSEIGVQHSVAQVSVVGVASPSSGVAKEFTALRTGSADVSYQYHGTPMSATFELRVNGVSVPGTSVTANNGFFTKNDTITVNKGDTVTIWVTNADDENNAALVKNASIAQTVWTSDYTLSGRAYLYVRLQHDFAVYPTGLPDISCIAQGKKLYDPRTLTTVFTNNPALVIRDYLLNGYGADSTEVNDTDIITAANICDQTVSVPDGSGGTTTQARYTCDGAVNTGAPVREIMEALQTSCDGSLVWTQGQYRLQVGAYTAPVGSLSETDLRDGISVIPQTPRKEIFNGVRGTFVDPAKNYVETDFPPYLDATFVTEDNGDVIYRDITLPYTRDVYRSQRLAKLMLAKARVSETITFPAKLTATKYQVNDTVNVTINRLGYVNKEFKVINRKRQPTGGVDLVLRAENSTVYDWVSGDATEITEIPGSVLPSAWDIEPPSQVTATEISETLNDGTVNSVIEVAWVLADTAIVENYQIRWKLTTDSTWLTKKVEDDITRYRIGLTEAGKTYQVEVRSLNRVGVPSGWITADNVSIVGKVTAPNDPGSLALSSAINAIELTWSNSALDDDLRHIEIWEATSNDRTTALVIDKRLGEQIYLKRDPVITYYYWIRAVNKSGATSNFHPNTLTTPVTGNARNVTGADVENSTLDASKFLGTVRPIQIVTALPTLPDGGYPIDSMIFLTTNRVSYYNKDNTDWFPVSSNAGDQPGVTGASLLYNWNFKIVDSDGKPAGIRGVESAANRGNLSYSDADNGYIKIDNSAGGTASAYGFPAIPIDDTQQYRVTIRHQSTGTTVDGLYLRFNELNTTLSTGKTHIGNGASVEGVTQQRTSLVDVVNDGAFPGSTWVEATFTYTPTTGVRFASFSMYNWRSNLEDYFIDQVTIEPIAGTLQAGDIIGQGAFATLNQITPGNVATYIAALSITANQMSVVKLSAIVSELGEVHAEHVNLAADGFISNDLPEVTISEYGTPTYEGFFLGTHPTLGTVFRLQGANSHLLWQNDVVTVENLHNYDADIISGTDVLDEDLTEKFQAGPGFVLTSISAGKYKFNFVNYGAVTIQLEYWYDRSGGDFQTYYLFADDTTTHTTWNTSAETGSGWLTKSIYLNLNKLKSQWAINFISSSASTTARVKNVKVLYDKLNSVNCMF